MSVLQFVSQFYHFPPIYIITAHISHHVVGLPSGAPHLLYHVPVLQTVLDQSAVKRVLVASVGRPEMPVATVVGPLISGQIEDDGVQLQREKVKEGKPK